VQASLCSRPEPGVNWHAIMATPRAQPGGAAKTPAPRIRLLGLDALQILDNGLDVVRAEQENRNVRMNRDDALGKRLREVLDRIFARQRAERRRRRVRAVAHLADGMA